MTLFDLLPAELWRAVASYLSADDTLESVMIVYTTATPWALSCWGHREAAIRPVVSAPDATHTLHVQTTAPN